MKKILGWRTVTHFGPWMRMFSISALLTLAVVGLGAMDPRQGWVSWVLIALFLLLGWISPENRWGAVLGSTSCAVLLLYLVLPTEYGAAGQFWYSLGFLVFSTLFIVPAATLTRWSR
jgi:hypothetical protein